MNEVKLILRHPKAVLPIRKTIGSSGFDICSVHDFIIGFGDIQVIDTGLDVAYIPDGFEIQVRPRSGLALEHGITVVNSPGTIDSDYRGPIKVILSKLRKTKSPSVFTSGARVAQLVICPVSMETPIIEVSEQTSETDRGSGGFGSTGI